MFISSAYAQTATAAGAQNPAQGILMLLFVVAIFYFLLIRPQSKRLKEHRAMIKGLKRGDEVITSGGIIGKIVKVESDDILAVEIAEGITVQVARSMVAELAGKKEMPAPANDTHAAEAKPNAAKPKTKKIKAAGKNVANDN